MTKITLYGSEWEEISYPEWKLLQYNTLKIMEDFWSDDEDIKTKYYKKIDSLVYPNSSPDKCLGFSNNKPVVSPDTQSPSKLMVNPNEVQKTRVGISCSIPDSDTFNSIIKELKEKVYVKYSVKYYRLQGKLETALQLKELVEKAINELKTTEINDEAFDIVETFDFWIKEKELRKSILGGKT